MVSQIPNQLRSLVLETISSSVSFGEYSITSSLSEEIGDTSQRFVITLMSSQGEQLRFFLKLYDPACFSDADSSIVRKRAKSGYLGLARAHHVFARVERFIVPRPIRYFPDYNAILMEFIPGVNYLQFLRQHLTRWGWLHQEEVISQYAGLCGEMLAFLQNHTYRARKRVPRPFVQRLLLEVKDDLNACLPFGLSHRLYDQYCDLIDEIGSFLLTQETHSCYQHTDFKMKNIILSGKKVALVDFPKLQHGSPYYDAAEFCIHLRTLSAKNPLIARPLKRIELAFMKKYLQHCCYAEQFSKEFFQAYMGLLLPYYFRGHLETIESSGRWNQFIRSLLVRKVLSFFEAEMRSLLSAFQRAEWDAFAKLEQMAE